MISIIWKNSDCPEKFPCGGIISGEIHRRLPYGFESVRDLREDISLVRINVGGSDKVLWDISGIYSSMEHRSGFSPSAVIIPQNSSYVISYYRMGTFEAGVYAAPVTDEIAWLQLVGVVVEPRGKVISP